ncbi:MAG: DMT family transporter, partial [Pseudomonadota bacterium]
MTGAGSARAGMAMMIAAMLIAPGLDVFAKLLMEGMPPAQVAFGRFAAQSLVLLPFFVFGSRAAPALGHAMAGAFLACALLTINLALREMPVANAIAIFFVEPLVLTVLAAIFLGERIGWRRMAAVVVGLIGALVVLRPNLAAYGPAAAWPLATAVFFSGYMLVTRAMSLSTDPSSRAGLQFWTGIFAAITLAVAGSVWAALDPAEALVLPTRHQLELIGCMGALAALSHRLILMALARVEAGLAAPFQYIEIVSATLLGWLVFGDFPDALT